MSNEAVGEALLVVPQLSGSVHAVCVVGWQWTTK